MDGGVVCEMELLVLVLVLVLVLGIGCDLLTRGRIEGWAARASFF
jgi:hypothetical protein